MIGQENNNLHFQLEMVQWYYFLHWINSLKMNRVLDSTLVHLHSIDTFKYIIIIRNTKKIKNFFFLYSYCC
jgi:hypothetical protein